MDVLISVENFEDWGTALEINSPRSLESCLRSGLDPSELFPKPYEKFVSKGLTKEMIEIKLDNFEKKRREKIMIVKIERNSIIQYADRHNQMTYPGSRPQTAHNNLIVTKDVNQKESSLLEMEEKRLEVLKKRKEKEIEKIVEREQIMANLQTRIQRVEEEDMMKRKAREKKNAELRSIETKKNILRMQELDRLEKLDAAKKRELCRRDQQFDQKMKAQALEAEKKLILEVRQRDDERIAKLEESRRKTDEMIQYQIEQAEISRLKMIERESRVQNQLKEKQESKKEEMKNEKEKAMKRIGEALDRHHVLDEEKKTRFFEKQRDAGIRAGEVVAEDRMKVKQQAEDREKKNKQRLGRLLDAYRTRSSHRQEIAEKRQEKDKTFGKVQAERESHQAMLKFASDMRIHDKIENVERVARMNEFHRLQTLKRIEDAEDRYENIQRQRHEILCKHKEDVKFSLTRKHEIANVMEQMKISNDFSMLDKLFVNKKDRSYNVGAARDAGDGEEERLNLTA